MSKLATKGLNGLKKKSEKQFIQEMVSNRSAIIREESVYVVDMFENGELKKVFDEKGIGYKK